MGLDVYLRWDGQTEAEENAQYTGFSIAHGHVGYLRESYAGDVFALPDFVRESFDASDGVAIPAATLRARLPAAEAAIRKRYEDSECEDMAIQSFRDFVSLAESLESAGRNPRILVS